jgi:hypothetical protein
VGRVRFQAYADDSCPGNFDQVFAPSPRFM